jgi:hypothetical protein
VIFVKTYVLGPTPNPPVVQFIYPDGSRSAVYALEGPALQVPDGVAVAAVEVRHLPRYPDDFPLADEPGWGHKDGAQAPLGSPGEGAVTKVEVRGPERFRRPRNA